MTVISIADKTPVAIPGGGVNGPWRTQSFNGESEFSLGSWNGRATVHLQVRLLLSDDETLWPTWFEVQTVRAGEDPTGAETYAVPPKKSQGFNYMIEMDVDPSKTLSVQMRHNGKADMQRLKGVVKIAPKVTEVVAR